ncbi:MAG: hypothetical protein H7067_18920, partial [Burkholderiales bacterium]|nr:hypothetical protein [Opitutaceae bacterium]
DREIITDLAWLLAVSADPAVRDGAEALRLAGALGAAGQAMDLRSVDALAAAYAETGDFAEARAIVAKALAIAEHEGDAAAIEEFEERSERYRQGRPFRLEASSSDRIQERIGDETGSESADETQASPLAP